MIGLESVYRLMGAMLVGVTVVELRDRANARRFANAMFWGLYAAVFLLGTYLPNVANGALAVAMVLVASIRGVTRTGDGETTEQVRMESARRWGNRLFIPALAIPFVTAGSLWLLKTLASNGRTIVDPKQVTQVAFAFAVVVALVIAMTMLRPALTVPALRNEPRRRRTR